MVLINKTIPGSQFGMEAPQREFLRILENLKILEFGARGLCVDAGSRSTFQNGLKPEHD